MAEAVGPSLSITDVDLGPREHWKLLGSGAFSTVYKAYCNRHNDFVAIKEIRRGSLQEVKKLVLSLAHKHIISIKGVDEDRNLIIMELCPYSLQGLRNRLGESFIPWPQCISFMQQIMSGLEYLHFLKIVHRDLKPANVLLTEDFVCKIADLGLAKDEGSHSNSIGGGEIRCPSGTPVYISPERWENPKQRAIETDDIYSCGILMYKMITNENIFSAEDGGNQSVIVESLILWVARKKRRPNIENIHKGGGQAPAIVEQLILACWDAEIDKRKTSKHWADLLREFINNNYMQNGQLERAKQQLKELLAPSVRKGPTPIQSSRSNRERANRQAGGDRRAKVPGLDNVDSHTSTGPQPSQTDDRVEEAPVVPSRIEGDAQPPLERGNGGVTAPENDDDRGSGTSAGPQPLQADDRVDEAPVVPSGVRGEAQSPLEGGTGRFTAPENDDDRGSGTTEGPQPPQTDDRVHKAPVVPSGDGEDAQPPLERGTGRFTAPENDDDRGSGTSVGPQPPQTDDRVDEALVMSTRVGGDAQTSLEGGIGGIVAPENDDDRGRGMSAVQQPQTGPTVEETPIELPRAQSHRSGPTVEAPIVRSRSQQRQTESTVGETPIEPCRAQRLRTKATVEVPIIPSRAGEESQPPLEREARGNTAREIDDDRGRQKGVQLLHLSSRVDLEESMRNLSVEGGRAQRKILKNLVNMISERRNVRLISLIINNVDVIILEDRNDVARHYGLKLFTQYKLNFHHGAVEQLQFHDGSEPFHIPRSMVQSYRLGDQGGNTLQLYFRSRHAITLSVSSIETAVRGLQALSVPPSLELDEMSVGKPLKTDDFSLQKPNPKGHHNGSSYGYPRKQPPTYYRSPKEQQPPLKSQNQPVVPSHYPGDTSPAPHQGSPPPSYYQSRHPSPLRSPPNPDLFGQRTHPPTVPCSADPSTGDYSTPPREQPPHNWTESHRWSTNQPPSAYQSMPVPPSAGPSAGAYSTPPREQPPHDWTESHRWSTNQPPSAYQSMPVPPSAGPSAGAYSTPPREQPPHDWPESHRWSPNQPPSAYQSIQEPSFVNSSAGAYSTPTRDQHPHHWNTPGTYPWIPNQPNPSMSGISIGTVKNFYYSAAGGNTPITPGTNQRPPYDRAELTDSADMVTQDDMLQVQAEVSRNYERVGRLLKLEDGEIENIRAQYPGNLEEASYQLMKAWVHQNASSASKAWLAAVLYEARLYDAARRIL